MNTTKYCFHADINTLTATGPHVDIMEIAVHPNFCVSLGYILFIDYTNLRLLQNAENKEMLMIFLQVFVSVFGSISEMFWCGKPGWIDCLTTSLLPMSTKVRTSCFAERVVWPGKN